MKVLESPIVWSLAWLMAFAAGYMIVSGGELPAMPAGAGSELAAFVDWFGR